MLYAEILRQRLKLVNAHIVADTIDYLEAKFEFRTDDWDGLDKWAHFAKDSAVYDIRLTGNCIRKEDHLNLSAGMWKVYLHGNEFRDGEVVQRITTDEVVLYVIPTGTLDGEPFPTVPPSAGEQIIAAAVGSEARAKESADAAGRAAKSAKDSADLAKKSAEIVGDAEQIVQDALRDAKESGEFDGEDGITPQIGANGNWFVGETDTGVRAQGKDGAKGDPGDDYTLTAEDKQEIAGLIPGGGNVGNVLILVIGTSLDSLRIEFVAPPAGVSVDAAYELIGRGLFDVAVQVYSDDGNDLTGVGLLRGMPVGDAVGAIGEFWSNGNVSLVNVVLDFAAMTAEAEVMYTSSGGGGVVTITKNADESYTCSHTPAEIAEMAQTGAVVAGAPFADNDNLILLPMMGVFYDIAVFEMTFVEDGDVGTVIVFVSDDAVVVQEDANRVAPMTGASAADGGKPGTVPAPSAGQQDAVLHGDGTWREVAGGGTSVEIDSTLTQAGKAADAKAVGDKIGEVSKAIADLENKVDGAKTWDYTEGLPEANGYKYVGTQGKAVMQSNGVALSSGAEYRFPFANASESTIEFKFTITKTPSNYWGFVVIVSNGTKGIRLAIHGGIVYFCENSNNNLKVADITENEEHSLRVEYFATGKADVYLDDNRIITNSISVPEYTETLFKQSSVGTTLLHSITYSIPEVDGDYIPVPKTATVGQTIVVESVDASGKPTAWKAVDLPSNTGGETATNVTEVPYRWAKRGYMRDHVRDFQGWAHCVQYDPDLELAVGIVISGTGSHSNSQPWYRVTIDPNTGYMSDYQEITLDYGEAIDTTEAGYVGSFLIFPDGTYWMCDYQRRIWHSADKGISWSYVKEIENWNRTTKNNDSLFGATILSNGRIVAGNIGQPAAETYYSDDDGLSWNTVKMNISSLGSQVYPEGGYKPFEPFFVDCGDGKVIQYARASMNAYKTYADGGCSVREAACYSISEDYGVTWSAWKWSTSLTDMTACNGRAVVIGDKVHAVYGSRYHADDNHFHLFYALTTTEDILNDKWESPTVIEVGHWNSETATNDHDCGYPSLFVADGNLFAVYYDSDGTGSAYGANWRLCVGSQGVAQIAPVTNDGKGSNNVGYAQSAVDALIQGLLTKINDLYLKIGELPEQGELDGSMPVLDGLVAWFELGDSTQYADDGYTIKSKIGEHTGQRLTSGAQAILTSQFVAPDKFDGNMVSGGVLFDNTLEEYGITGAFTMEFVLDVWDNQLHYLLLASPIKTFGNNTVIYSHNNGYGSGYVKVAHHVTVVFTPDVSTVIYINGEEKQTASALTSEQVATAHPICRAFNGATGGVRLYNRVLTADEITNNYKYAKTLTEIGTDIWTSA